MPVEIEDTAGCLEPVGIGQTPQQLLRSAIGKDMRGDLAREARKAREEPRWHPAGLQRKIGEAGATGLVKSYEFLRRVNVTTVRASGSNPKFRMNSV
jgi:hypothetical protein